MAEIIQECYLTAEEKKNLIHEVTETCKLMDQVDKEQSQSAVLYQHLEEKCRTLGQILEIVHHPFNSDNQAALESKRQHIATLDRLIAQHSHNY